MLVVGDDAAGRVDVGQRGFAVDVDLDIESVVVEDAQAQAAGKVLEGRLVKILDRYLTRLSRIANVQV